jgi:hypothetical protein
MSYPSIVKPRVKDPTRRSVVSPTMPESPSVPLLGAFGASLLAACQLPTANLQLTTEAPKTAETKPTAVAKRERKPGLDRRRPEIVDAELLSGDHLRLRFSEPLAPLDGVDPNDFRLSLGMSYAYKFYAYAYYMDLVDTIDGDHEGLLRLADMSGQGDTIDLHLEPDFDLAYCHELMAEIAEMQQEPGIRYEAGLFLHYSPGPVPVTDEAGNGLSPVGADWVLVARRGGDEAYELYFEGPEARRAMRGLIPVECGPAPVDVVATSSP